MLLNGRIYSREDLYRYIGDPQQVFGIRAMEYRSGEAGLVKTYEVETGGGLSFSVGENKGLDIYRLNYRGVNFGFMSKAGLHSPYNVNQESEAFRCTQGCGMLYTAGITNVGGPCSDELGTYWAHGGIKNGCADNICARGIWENDEYRMEISGEMREAAFYGRNLNMRRTISAYAGGKAFVLEDEIENRAFMEDQVMLLYHFNTGFPLLNVGAQMYAPVKTIEGATSRSQEMLEQHTLAVAPIPMEEEYVYLLTLKKDAEGMSGSLLWNDELKLGVYVKFNADVLNRFVEWKCMRAGDYALGMLPSNCYPFGREDAKNTDGWTRLRPFEKMRTHLEIGVVDTEEEKESFRRWLDQMQ